MIKWQDFEYFFSLTEPKSNIIFIIPNAINPNMGILNIIYHYIFGDENKQQNLDFDLKALKENLRKIKEQESEEKTKIRIEEKEISEIRLIVQSYTVKPNIPSDKKLPYYWNITCCKSCWFCFDSACRPLRCVKHCVKNHFNGYCDDYRYNGIQPPE